MILIYNCFFFGDFSFVIYFFGVLKKSIVIYKPRNKTIQLFYLHQNEINEQINLCVCVCASKCNMTQSDYIRCFAKVRLVNSIKNIDSETKLNTFQYFYNDLVFVNFQPLLIYI